MAEYFAQYNDYIITQLGVGEFFRVIDKDKTLNMMLNRGKVVAAWDGGVCYITNDVKFKNPCQEMRALTHFAECGLVTLKHKLNSPLNDKYIHINALPERLLIVAKDVEGYYEQIRNAWETKYPNFRYKPDQVEGYKRRGANKADKAARAILKVVGPEPKRPEALPQPTCEATFWSNISTAMSMLANGQKLVITTTHTVSLE